MIAHLPRVRDMGFDVLYFPPIHPIGTKARKGKNNTLTPAPDTSANAQSRSVMIPCPDCGGTGIAHCCDGICEQPDRAPPKRA